MPDAERIALLPSGVYQAAKPVVVDPRFAEGKSQ